ncbi:hypothetical protein C7999DRAFT_37129 [Corynascus novoguineensis]|uniref:Uncharacterized protein n=1 Tax=Corynascus novoguineensis TaxID=1126955 RepID=A0AAN7HUY8_9PEZI|nr:hypothetical protein C7999DRAFT_37129 [Corynascus novoguineensis]
MSPTLQRPREGGSLSPAPSPPTSELTLPRPATPSTPVQIPVRPKSRGTAHPQISHHSRGDRSHRSTSRRSRDAHSRDGIPPSVAALLAVTSIPPPKAARSVRQIRAEKRMTVESIIERAQESEKELSMKLSKSPLDILLMAPEDLETDDTSVCGSVPESVLSTQTISMESMPSLSDSIRTDNTLASLETPPTPLRRRRVQPTRRSLEPISSPPGESESHPLSSPESEVDELDFSVFANKEEMPGKKTPRLPFNPIKSAFKSNLTASLRALRQAARSFSNLNFSSIPPEDFLTRSILTLDPQVPYTDERRPPPLEEEPTAALRRYLNPTTTARIEKPQPVADGPALRTFTASIQMQTYKIHRSRSASPSPGRSPHPSVGPSCSTTPATSGQPKVTEHPVPGPRQREMRENSDFIRIAVMEMAMRKSGKLDDQRPGRARWALPPRKPSTRPYEIRPDGVPARWVAVTH